LKLRNINKSAVPMDRADLEVTQAKSGLSPWINGIAVLQSVAKAVPVLGAPVEGSIEAVKQILQYTKVSRFRG
jgi:hypothetical protein